MRLGEFLVQERLLSVAQLEEALRGQILYGGRLGTNLVENKVLTLDTLGNALGKLHGVTVATQRQLDNIDPRTSALISRELARRRLAIPLGITKVGRRLAVAFCDPRDQAAIDEVAFAVQMTVVPNAAPELRVLYQLEKRYGVPRPNRFLRVVQAPVPIELPVERRTHVPSMESMVTLAVEVKTPIDLPTAPAPAAAVAAAPGAPAAFSMPDVQLPPAGQAPPRASTAPVAAPAPAAAPVPAPVVEAAPARRPAIGAAEALARLATADTRDAVGDLIVDYLRSAFGVGLTFIVKQEMALGWKGFAPGVDPSLVEALTMALASPSIFRTSWETGASFRGAPPAAGAVLHGHMWKVLKVPPPAEVIVSPIAIKGRVVNLVYAHAVDGGVLPDSAVLDLTGVCAAATTAFSRLIQAKRGA